MQTRHRIPVYSVYQTRGHPALALGMIVAFAKVYKNGLLNEHYEFVPEIISSLKIMQEVVGKHGPGIFLCSNYLWSNAHNLEISKFVKVFFPTSITVHGGPSAPKHDYGCEEYCGDHPYVDIVARGAGEVTTAELLEQLAIHAADYAQGGRDFLSNVAGITFRSGEGELVRTQDRPAARDLDALPSPYLTGEFLGQDTRDWRAAIVETNRGCPYGCTFCDWGSATLSKIRQFSLERVFGEIEWIAKNGTEILWIADANFGIFDRDVHVAQFIADCRAKYDFPKRVFLNYAKNATGRLAQIVEILRTSNVIVDGIISIQTRDPETLSIIERSNISTERYEDLIEIFARHKLPITSELMLGLPGATLESFKADLQFFFDRAVPVRTYDTVLLPNSPMAHRDYRKKYQIEADASNRVVSTHSYTQSDLKRMKRLSSIYTMAVEASVLKYLLIYLQLDHGIPAVDVLSALNEQVDLDTTTVPYFAKLLSDFPATISSMSSADWDRFYAEIGHFLVSSYGIDQEALKTVLHVQNKIMPAKDRMLPETVILEQDFGAYYAKVRGARNLEVLRASAPTRLTDYESGTLGISDPDDLCGVNSDHLERVYHAHRIEWELTSSLTAKFT